jgi:hypothetical protein
MPDRVMAVIQQRIDQSPAVDAGRRMHDHALRLVDDDDILIFIQDIQRDILRPDFDRRAFRNLQTDRIIAAQAEAAAHVFAVDLRIARFNQFLNAGTRKIRAETQIFVEALAGIFQHGPAFLAAHAFFSSRNASMISRPTPMQSAESAMLKTGKS